MKIAVTSASGPLGNAIIQELEQHLGASGLIALARTPENVKMTHIEARPADYLKPDELDMAMKDVDVVVLISGNDEPHKRIHQHRNVIEAAKANGVSKIIYTSIIGKEDESDFAPIVVSNRKTEADIRDSGLGWVIGRNGLYIDADLEYVEHYVVEGEIVNAAGKGLCSYTSRDELAKAYAKLVIEDHLKNQTYTLTGETITQSQLAEIITEVYDENVEYREVSVQDFLWSCKARLGDYFGTVVSGIYESIQLGHFNEPGDFEHIMGRPHKTMREIIEAFKDQ